MDERPGTVRAASVLLVAVGLGYLVDAVALLIGAGQYVDRVRAAFDTSRVDPTAFDFVRPFAGAAPYLTAVFVAVSGLVLLGLAGSVRAGHQAGRIVTWVAAGLALSCSFCAFGAAGTPGFSGMVTMNAFSGDATGQHRFSQRLPAGYPPVYRYLSGGIAFVAMLVLILVIILLATPSANRYFRPVPVPVAVRPPVPAPPVPAAPAPLSTVDIQSQLSIMERQHQRGELTAEELAEARRRLLG